MEELVTADEFRRRWDALPAASPCITVETAEGGVHGMTANAFCSVSLRPPLVLVCVDQLAETYLHLRERGRFGVSILKEDQEALSEFFADPERNPDAAYRLGIEYETMKSGTPVLEGCSGAIWTARWSASHPAGDHTIFVGEVNEVVAGRRRAAAVFSRTLRTLPSEQPSRLNALLHRSCDILAMTIACDGCACVRTGTLHADASLTTAASRG